MSVGDWESKMKYVVVGTYLLTLPWGKQKSTNC